jgi:DNA-binding CsgD family transcriptional regulator
LRDERHYVSGPEIVMNANEALELSHEPPEVSRLPKVSELVEELVRCAGRTGAPGVLLDVEVDGVRCLLVRTPPQPDHRALSPREREIARMVAAGHPNKAIAAVLDISEWTVNAHLRRVFAKLGVSSRAAMVAKLMR